MTATNLILPDENKGLIKSKVLFKIRSEPCAYGEKYNVKIYKDGKLLDIWRGVTVVEMLLQSAVLFSIGNTEAQLIYDNEYDWC